MLRQIQLIGNNVCACDARCGAAERGMVQKYVVLLENFIEESKFSIGQGGQKQSRHRT